MKLETRKMKKATILQICFLLFAIVKIYAQTTVPAGQVYGHWTLAGSPYNITGSITIPNDSTLKIDAGVNVVFQGHFKFNVNGNIIAIGTALDTIKFTANNIVAGWFGFRFNNTPTTNDSSIFRYCKIQYGKATGSFPDSNGGGFYFDGFSKAEIDHCYITNCSSTK